MSFVSVNYITPSDGDKRYLAALIEAWELENFDGLHTDGLPKFAELHHNASGLKAELEKFGTFDAQGRFDRSVHNPIAGELQNRFNSLNRDNQELRDRHRLKGGDTTPGAPDNPGRLVT